MSKSGYQRQACVLGFACCLFLAVWVAAAPAPFRRNQEAVTVLAVETDDRAEKVRDQLRAFQAQEGSAACRLTFEESKEGRRTIYLRLQTDGKADAQKRLSDLVERCLRAVFPSREFDTVQLWKYRDSRREPDVALPDTRMAQKAREFYDYLIESLASELHRQEAALVVQPPHRVRR
jgi:hypothetical protein